MKTRHIALLSIAILGLTACQGRRFEPSSVVSKFRVLGVQADPPELRPGDTTTVRALATVPSGAPIFYRWDWCPFFTSGNNYYECPVTQEDLEAQIENSLPEGVPANLFSFPDFDLGTEDTATLPYPIPQPLLIAFCEAIAQASAEAGEDSQFAQVLPQLSCSEDYEISVRVIASVGEPVTDEMVANLRDQDPSRVIVAAKRVTLWLDSENEQDINPRIEELQIRPKFEEDKDLLLDAGHDWVGAIDDFENDWVSVDPEADPLPILVGVRYQLRSIVDPDSIQTYSKLAPAGEDSERRYAEAKSEVLVYNWFASAGALTDNEALFVDGSTPLDDAGTAELFIPLTDTSQDVGGANGQRFIDACPELEDSDDSNGCSVSVWSVVRDDRRGQTWQEAQLVATAITEDGHRGGGEQ